MDVYNAFLYGDLDEEVYMKPSLSFVSLTIWKMCRLCKSLYGICQASSNWLTKLYVLCEIMVLNSHSQITSSSLTIKVALFTVFLSMWMTWYLEKIIRHHAYNWNATKIDFFTSRISGNSSISLVLKLHRVLMGEHFVKGSMRLTSLQCMGFKMLTTWFPYQTTSPT